MSELKFGYATHVGRVRRANQDRYFVDGSVFVVADGMGGHSGGEIASGLAVEALAEWPPIGALTDVVSFVHHANDQIVATAHEDPTLRGMGTTISVLATLDGPDDEMRFGIANVGDSRIYRLADGELDQLTEDHSLVEALVRDGRLTPDEASRHPQRNILTRALGIDEKVLVDAWEIRAVSGDQYLICSDGLFNELSGAEIVELMVEAADAQAAAELLVAEACDAGGHDNVTVVVVDVADGPEVVATDERVVTARRAVPDTRGIEADRTPAGSDEDEAGDTANDETKVSSVDPMPPADDAPALAETVTAGDGLDETKRSRLDRRLILLVAAVVVVVVLAVTAAAAYARSAYYLGVDGPEVVIFKGRPGGFLWFEPTVEEPINVGVVELSDADLEMLQDNVEFGAIGEAHDYGVQLALRTRDGA